MFVQHLLSPHISWQRYGQSALLVAVATLLGQPIRPFIAPTNLVMLYLLVVVISAVRLGRGPAVLAAVLGVLAFDLFFVPPRFTLGVADTQYLLTFAGLLLVGLVVSALAAHANVQAEAARRREVQTIASYELSRDLAAASETGEIAQILLTHVARVFDSEVSVFLARGEKVIPQIATPGFVQDERSQAVAIWVFRHEKEVHPGVKPFAAIEVHYLPLKTAQAVLGVLGVKRRSSSLPFSPEQRRLLDSFASQAALALERAQLAEKARDAELLRATEELQTALLNSISHDLRTPLASITGALSSLLEGADVLDESKRRDLLETAWGEADRLNHLVSNLLDMTRLEAGAMNMKREPYDVQELIGVALERLSDRLQDRPVHMDLPDDLPLVPMDFMLMVQVMVNLLDNALKYSPPDSPIEIHARAANACAEITVTDQGMGIPEEDLARVFAKFYRVPRVDGVGGTGLGLSISKGIVEAHGGRIWIESRQPTGTRVTVALPLVSSADERKQG